MYLLSAISKIFQIFVTLPTNKFRYFVNIINRGHFIIIASLQMLFLMTKFLRRMVDYYLPSFLHNFPFKSMMINGIPIIIVQLSNSG